jgi:hypothetical protein
MQPDTDHPFGTAQTACRSEPGVLVWHTPAGRTYSTTPTWYAA